LFQKSVRYLGNLITTCNHTIDPADTAAVNNLRDKRPKTVGDVRQLMGFIGFYRGYIPEFSRRAKPIYDLLKEESSPEVKRKIRSTKRKGERSCEME
jgi:hypothetical protein